MQKNQTRFFEMTNVSNLGKKGFKQIREKYMFSFLFIICVVNKLLKWNLIFSLSSF